ncbi:hypothetical protein NQ315_015172 [Exocentrus adspersus]|uniref:CCHC-type domain-containing protein n=1 Tax=Exocentrus adspersus TaxID=1586481 RepID=A0AAV8VC47_9CUCU|nr:hypothetical protein NQ315_015172 [Exocentrus adspersus]
MLSAMKENLKRGQEEMKEDMKRGQEEMKASQEEVKVSQEEMKEYIKAIQEKLLQEMKTAIEENKTKLDTKLNEFEQVVEEEINLVKDDVKAIKEEVNKKIEELETKVAQLSIEALRGEALEVLRTIPEASPNYATLTSALERRYGDAHLQHVYRTQLRSSRQRFEETLQQYEADISRIVNLAYPTAPAEVIEQLSVSSFIEGLRDPEIDQLVRLSRHKSISEALVHALEIEAVKEASRAAINPYLHRDKKTKITDGNLIDLLLELLQQFKKGEDLGSFTPNGERKPICCWTCGAEGHVRRRCPQNDSLQKAPDPSTSQVRQIRVFTRQNQDVKMKKTHIDLNDWMSHILEKHKNKRYSENSTFNERRRIRCWTCGAEEHMRSRCQQSNSVVKNPGVSEITRQRSEDRWGVTKLNLHR